MSKNEKLKVIFAAMALAMETRNIEVPDFNYAVYLALPWYVRRDNLISEQEIDSVVEGIIQAALNGV